MRGRKRLYIAGARQRWRSGRPEEYIDLVESEDGVWELESVARARAARGAAVVFVGIAITWVLIATTLVATNFR